MKLIITETEKNRIRNLYYLNEQNTNQNNTSNFSLIDNSGVIIGEDAATSSDELSIANGNINMTISQALGIPQQINSNDFQSINKPGVYVHLMQTSNNIISNALTMALIARVSQLNLQQNNVPFDNLPPLTQNQIVNNISGIRQNLITDLTINPTGPIDSQTNQPTITPQDITNYMNTLNNANGINNFITSYRTYQSALNTYLNQNNIRINAQILRGSNLLDRNLAIFNFEDKYSVSLDTKIVTTDTGGASKTRTQAYYDLHKEIQRDYITLLRNNHRRSRGNSNVTIPPITAALNGQNVSRILQQNPQININQLNITINKMLITIKTNRMNLNIQGQTIITS